MEYVKCVYSARQIVSAQNTLAIKEKEKRGRGSERVQREATGRGRWLVTRGQPSLTYWESDSPRKDTEIKKNPTLASFSQWTFEFWFSSLILQMS